MNKMHELIQIAKGMIAPGDLNPGGTLRPQTSARLISLVAQDTFLQHALLRRMSRTTADIMVADIAARQLMRIPEGILPTTAQRSGASQKGSTLHALPVQYFPFIGLSWLRDNADNPNLLSDVEAMFTGVMRRDIVDLAFNGTLDDNSAGFLTLNKGWIQLCADSVLAATGVAEVVSLAADKWVTRLGDCLDALPLQYRNDAAFVMNTADADLYWRELGLHVTGSAILTEDPRRKFSGYQIYPSIYCPRNTVLCTPIKNLVYGLSTNIQQDKKYDSERRGISYTFDTANDFALGVLDATVYGHI